MLWFAGINRIIPMTPLSDMLTLITSKIQSGPFGIAGLIGVAACILIPITQYNAMYGISVGYGLSVAAIGWTLYATFSLDLTSIAGWLVAATCFQGMRLASYLFLRDMGGWKPSAEYNHHTFAPWQRISLAMFLAVLYAIMTTPVLYACRNPSTSNMAMTGTALAWFAAIMEGIADGHKHVIKRARVDTKNKTSFRGPSGGLYRVTRHPNYTAELLFWVSLLLAGYPSLPPIPLALSVLGLFAIASIMVGSTKRLEKRHQETYGLQTAYKQWKSRVPHPLIPFMQGLGSNK